MKKVAIIPGLFEGSAQAAELRPALTHAGLEVTSDLTCADVVIAHSGGCFFAGEAAEAELVILAGPPYNPSRSVASSLLSKVVRSPKGWRFFRRSLLRTYPRSFFAS